MMWRRHFPDSRGAGRSACGAPSGPETHPGAVRFLPHHTGGQAKACPTHSAGRGGACFSLPENRNEEGTIPGEERLERWKRRSAEMRLRTPDLVEFMVSPPDRS